MKARIFRTCPLILVVACVVGDVGGGESGGGSSGAVDSTGDATPAATIVGQVDVIDLCGIEGAKVVSFRATRIGCEQAPPAPCTIKTDPYEEIVGDAAVCPASQNALDMAITIEAAGRFQVEARALTDNGYVGRCFGPEGGGTSTLVTREQVESGGSVAVFSRAGPCPSP